MYPGHDLNADWLALVVFVVIAVGFAVGVALAIPSGGW